MRFSSRLIFAGQCLIALAAYLTAQFAHVDASILGVGAWSESGRVFESYLASQLLQGSPIAWPWLDPGRAVLEGLVWLLPQADLPAYRAWVQSLSLGVLALSAVLLVRSAWNANRRPEMGSVAWAGAALFAFFFLAQGPVYPHLLLSIVPVLLFYDRKKPRAVLLSVLAGSLWAGLTRPNWFLMPAATAALLRLLEDEEFAWRWESLRLPVLWAVCGGAASLSVYALSLRASRMPSVLAPDMDFGFLISKLAPNPWFPPGLLGGAVILSLPLVVVLAASPGWKRFRQNRSRAAALLLGLGLLAAGGAYIGMRLGGGYDLHNYDAYLTLFLLSFLQIALRPGEPGERGAGALNLKTLSLLMVVPLLLALQKSVSLEPPKSTPAQRDAAAHAVCGLLSSAQAQGARILFLNYRPLALEAGFRDAAAWPYYEQIPLMEMVMGANRAYLDRFETDLRAQTFEFIVADVQMPFGKEPDADPNWYESNLWAREIAAPLVENYRVIYRQDNLKIAVYQALGSEKKVQFSPNPSCDQLLP